MAIDLTSDDEDASGTTKPTPTDTQDGKSFNNFKNPVIQLGSVPILSQRYFESQLKSMSHSPSVNEP